MADRAVNQVAPNTPNVLDTSHAALGIDTARALHVDTHRWAQFFDLWQKRRRTLGAPVFAGRYFGYANRWVPGEAQKLRKSVPSAEDLRYIVALNQPAQGRTAGSREQGRADAEAAGRAIKAALEHFTSPETCLLPPEAGSLFVFLCLDVQPQLQWTLDPRYWMGWSEALQSFDAGTTLLPALYCPLWTSSVRQWSTTDQNKSVKRAFQAQHAPGWDGARHRCHALATASPWYTPDFEGALRATEQTTAASWPDYEELAQPGGLTAPVVLWQYRLNIVMTADVGAWQKKGSGPEIKSTGAPSGRYHFTVKIAKDGPRGTAEFQYSTVKGGKLSAPHVTAAEYEIPHTGVSLTFPDGTYSAGTTYEATAELKLQDGEHPVVGTQVLDVDLLAAAPDGHDGRPITDYMLRVPDYTMAPPEPVGTRTA